MLFLVIIRFDQVLNDQNVLKGTIIALMIDIYKYFSSSSFFCYFLNLELYRYKHTTVEHL